MLLICSIFEFVLKHDFIVYWSSFILSCFLLYFHSFLSHFIFLIIKPFVSNLNYDNQFLLGVWVYGWNGGSFSEPVYCRICCRRVLWGWIRLLDECALTICTILNSLKAWFFLMFASSISLNLHTFYLSLSLSLQLPGNLNH